MLSRRQTAKSGDLSYEQQQTYSDYYDTYSGQTRPNAEILLNGADFQSADCAQYEVGSYTGEEDGSTRDNALIWNSADGSFTYTIQVPETGVYSIEATYCPLVSNTSEISFSLAIDGEIPYDTASRLTLNKVYRNREDMKEDSKGNQVRPTQVQTEMWRTCWIGDSDGLFNEPLLFYLEQGTHEITLSSQKAYFALESLRFAQPEEVPTYAEYVNSTDAAVEAWVSLGRDQAQVVKDLVESEFQQQYNVPISINLVVGGVVEATLADKGPDVALFLGGEFPVNLAARGLLADLSQMDGYDDMTKLYQDTAMVPYQYEGGTYGMPLTRSWAMMFYRKDVLSELGFSSAPKTWEDLIDMLPAFQRNYMSAGLARAGVAMAAAVFMLVPWVPEQSPQRNTITSTTMTAGMKQPRLRQDIPHSVPSADWIWAAVRSIIRQIYSGTGKTVFIL